MRRTCWVNLAIPLLIWLLRGATFAQPEPTPPAPALLAITVPQGVVGDGKRDSPYTFDASTICVLMFPDPTLKAFEWDVDDSVSTGLIMPGKGALAFNLQKPGEYFVQCTWEGGKAKAWYVIKSSGPAPPPSPETVAKRVTKALTGDRSQEDAIALVVASEKILSELATFKDGKDLLARWGVLLAANKWVKGSRPEIAKLIGDAVPAGQAVPFTAVDRDRLAVLFQAILEGSKGALK